MCIVSYNVMSNQYHACGTLSSNHSHAKLNIPRKPITQSLSILTTDLEILRRVARIEVSFSSSRAG